MQYEQQWFGKVRRWTGLGILAAVVAISLLYVVVTELVKRRFYRK